MEDTAWIIFGIAWNGIGDLYIGDSRGNNVEGREEVLGIRRGDPRIPPGVTATDSNPIWIRKTRRFYDRNNVMYFFFFSFFFFFLSFFFWNFLTNMIAKFVGFLVEKSRK